MAIFYKRCAIKNGAVWLLRDLLASPKLTITDVRTAQVLAGRQTTLRAIVWLSGLEHVKGVIHASMGSACYMLGRDDAPNERIPKESFHRLSEISMGEDKLQR